MNRHWSEIKQLRREDKEHRQKLRILLEISRLLSSFLHLPEVLEGIIELLTKEYRFDTCSIRLFDDKGKLVIRSQRGLDQSLIIAEDLSPSHPDSCLMKCIKSGQIVIINDIASVDSSRLDGLILAEDTKSFALTPIGVEGQIIGVLCTASKKKNYFHERYGDAIYIIATQIGQAIRTAQLYDEIYHFSRYLEKKVAERTAQLKKSHERLVKIERHAALGKMANRIAHEFRNSLTVIGGFARRLHEKMPDNDSNKRYVEIITEEVILLEKKVAEIIELATEEQDDTPAMNDGLY